MWLLGFHCWEERQQHINCLVLWLCSKVGDRRAKRQMTLSVLFWDGLAVCLRLASRSLSFCLCFPNAGRLLPRHMAGAEGRQRQGCEAAGLIASTVRKQERGAQLTIFLPSVQASSSRTFRVPPVTSDNIFTNLPRGKFLGHSSSRPSDSEA